MGLYPLDFFVEPNSKKTNVPGVCTRFPKTTQTYLAMCLCEFPKSFLVARCFSVRKPVLHASGFSSLSPEAKYNSSKAQYRAKHVFSIVLAWHLEAILLSWPIKDSSA